MKKIMFNGEYGLTEAVLSGRKTMTRRAVKVSMDDLNTINAGLRDQANINATKTAIIKKYAAYQVGEVVAVAQSYGDVYATTDFEMTGNGDFIHDKIEEMLYAEKLPVGWNNKMFVKAELMPHHVRITDIGLERLQDISNEDCLKEGIFKTDAPSKVGYPFGCAYAYPLVGKRSPLFPTPRAAFASLIDKTSGKGTWERNNYVYVYTFEYIVSIFGN